MAALPLTLAIPLRLSPRRAREELQRLALILAAAPPETGIVVADDTPEPALRARTAAVVARRLGARHLVLDRPGETFSIGLLRDRATEAAQEGFVLFHDVDFAAPTDFYRRLAAHMNRGETAEDSHAFRCAPVWFLNRTGALAFRAAPERTWSALSRGAPMARALADRLTLGSSAMVLRRRTLLEAGGHSALFSGHGAEDFELMHRLSAASPMGPRPPNYARDYGSRDRGADGFRAYFARYAAPLLAEGLVMAHLWHPGRREDPAYYAARRENFARLQAIMQGEAAPDHAATSEPARF